MSPSTPSTWALWWRHSLWFKPGLPALTLHSDLTLD